MEYFYSYILLMTCLDNAIFSLMIIGKTKNIVNYFSLLSYFSLILPLAENKSQCSYPTFKLMLDRQFKTIKFEQEEN